MPAAYREVALKRINVSTNWCFDRYLIILTNQLDAIEDPAIKKITMNEVDQIKSLQHENIVECYYSFDEISPVSVIKIKSNLFTKRSTILRAPNTLYLSWNSSMAATLKVGLRYDFRITWP
jgi:hypothetical protein